MNSIPSDEEMAKMIKLLEKDDNESTGLPSTRSIAHLKAVHRALSIEEKAQLFDEQTEAADAVSSVLSCVERGADGKGATEQALIATLGLSRDDIDGMNEGENTEDDTLAFLVPLHRRRVRKTLWDKCCGNRCQAPHEWHSFRALMLMIGLTVIVIIGTIFVLVYGETSATEIPKRQPIGSYRAIEIQEGDSFFDYYNVYNGPDSKGSNGYVYYRNLQYAKEHGLVKILKEPVNTTILAKRRRTAVTTEEEETADRLKDSHLNETVPNGCDGCEINTLDEETFIYIGTKATQSGPRDSVRLEGKRRFNRGLFILDVRHMPAGCGTWPAFWLVDELNWPVNGEIDIVEGVNYQTVAKTALHSSVGCSQFNLPEGLATGGWDTAVGIPDRKTGKPDMTLRYSKNCFVYDAHQWLNQGCVAVDHVEGRLGEPLNAKGGGIYVLEWDPVNRHIRSWVFTPHSEAPQNLLDSISTASHPDPRQRVSPDPRIWPLPYGYYAIGKGTHCPASHFQNMHLVFNLALCGSVAGNRYFMDCPKEFKQFPTCNEYIASNPEALKEAYWKIKGVYVYEREWQRDWNGTSS